MITIALCLSTLNNGSTLDLTLKKLKGVVDEIFVIDKGSKDDTIIKAALFTGNVFEATSNNYSHVLSIVLGEAKSQYILYLNGDEDLSDDDIEKLEIMKGLYSDSEDYVKFGCEIGVEEIIPSLRVTRLVKREMALKLRTAVFESFVAEGKGVSIDIRIKKLPKEDSINIEEIYDNPLRILIGSYVNEDKEVLNKFLESLLKLNKEDLLVDYCFVDDNHDIESKAILQAFKRKQTNTTIFDVPPVKGSCLFDEEDNSCDEELMDRGIRFKNKILDYARIASYDYLFLIDSNIILYPRSLENLINARKDIVSNILWTRCNEEIEENQDLPQSWLNSTLVSDESKAIDSSSEEKLKDEREEFFNMLREPGYYKVGGAGNCVLLSRRVLLSGCNFNKIYNVSFDEEEMYFSLRAAALGFEMFVDTNYPANRIYKDMDDSNSNNDKETQTVSAR